LLPDFFPVVAVPARDEEERLPRLLSALAAQSWIAQGKRPLAVVVVLNNCTDASRDVARAAAALLPAIVLHLVEVAFDVAQAHVGSARRLALQRAGALVPAGTDGVLLTTDADAEPDPDWVHANLVALHEGADIVGGHIIGDPREEALLGPLFQERALRHLHYARSADRLAALIDPLPHDPWPRHQDHTGASLAVRKSVHDAVGGLPALPFREDLAFVSRVRAADYRLRHDPRVRVKVSARTEGRAPDGMADCLRHWLVAAEQGLPHIVEAPDSVLQRALRRHALRNPAAAVPADLRAAIEAERKALLAERPDLSHSEVIEILAPDHPGGLPMAPIDIAQPMIDALIEAQERCPDAA
jgi:cellulose synthase/poly-beta-1,6-N-acetylglucosamine synthase-like glycosyltransferase